MGNQPSERQVTNDRRRRQMTLWDDSRLHYYKVWKEAWDSGYYRSRGKPVKPTVDFNKDQLKRWEEKAKYIYNHVTSNSDEWSRHRKRYLARLDNGATIAAERAMTRASLQSSSELDRSDSSARQKRGNPRDPQPRNPASWVRTTRRYKPGQGLLNKTLRRSTPTRIPGPLDRHGRSIGPGIARDPSDESTTETYGALPSSYRKLRKAKSLFSPVTHWEKSQHSSWSSPRVTGRPLRSVTSSAVLPANNLRIRLKRSLTFLRPKSTLTMRTGADREWGGREEAVQMARAQFLDELEHQRLQERESTPIKMKLKVHHRLEATTSTPDHSQQLDDSPAGAGSLPRSPDRCSTKRSFSASLRNQFRKVLGRSTTAKDNIPPQQLEARRSHYLDLEDNTGQSSGFDSYVVSDVTQTVPPSVYLPLSPEYDALEDLDKFSEAPHSVASRESLHSNARSRVTSWTDSSMTGSIGLRSGPIDRKRLSVIKEDGGPHQPSSSAGRHFGGVEVFREPLQSVSNDGRVLPPVDSQRVYSALIKRISQEEDEIERTTAALEAINQTNTKPTVNFDRPTIRALRSDPSLTDRVSLAPDDQHREFSLGPYSWHEMENATSSGEDEHNVEKLKERLDMQESQSSFFPFSLEKNPGAPSPFKKLLRERRHRESSTNWTQRSDADSSSVIVKPKVGNSMMNRPRFGFSSESIYSRTTNGGINEQYLSPIGSSDDLINTSHPERAGMATIFPAECARAVSDGTIHPGAGRTQVPEWNPWSETLNAMTLGEAHQTSSHTREQAQIDSEHDIEPVQHIGRGLSSKLASATNNSHFPLPGLRTVPSSNTPKPKSTISVRKSRKGFIEDFGTDALGSISNKTNDDSRVNSSLRKLSPSNLGRLLKEKKSHISIRKDRADKENIPTEENDSPPVSTPGRPQLQFGAGNTTGRLRKRASKMAFNSQRGTYSTPQSAPKSIVTTPSRYEDSPCEKVKDQLVARLSRPFNMDVPPHNRPFDSTYLGKRTPGHPDTMGAPRLSVARPLPEVPEGVDSSAAEASDPPSGTLPVGRSASKVMGMFGSKRMVGNFLKSRKVSKSTSEDGQNMVGGSPAFI
ncbi:hypothetical protein H2202_002292 [Exophiala xenobiotica]|nr:hypothetical protein H2202_002292 [Exophiala xenobiotica]KAK5234823.1 hypothetical protein LTR47_004268 [Exophiala xenobiotica]KAK5245144.1 hypothetical protein LTS06_009390 [Exophiala xenobiotica]KAK5349468.1 hypothetical protein LTR61_006857 [Exophiala xenobiotica]KAK5373192.1 hypothetical protein LTR11_005931 [Exophiala xenobiotica]